MSKKRKDPNVFSPTTLLKGYMEDLEGSDEMIVPSAKRPVAPGEDAPSRGTRATGTSSKTTSKKRQGREDDRNRSRGNEYLSEEQRPILNDRSAKKREQAPWDEGNINNTGATNHVGVPIANTKAGGRSVPKKKRLKKNSSFLSNEGEENGVKRKERHHNLLGDEAPMEEDTPAPVQRKRAQRVEEDEEEKKLVKVDSGEDMSDGGSDFSAQESSHSDEGGGEKPYLPQLKMASTQPGAFSQALGSGDE